MKQSFLEFLAKVEFYVTHNREQATILALFIVAFIASVIVTVVSLIKS